MVNPATNQRPAEGIRSSASVEFLSSRFHVIPGENPDDFDALVRDYRRQFTPDGPAERYFLQTLILCDWKRRRLATVENRFLHSVSAAKPAWETLTAQDGKEAAILKALHRQQQSNERAYLRAFTELRKLQKQRQPAPAVARPKPEAGVAVPATAQPPQSPQTGGIGFVSQKTDQPAIPHYDLGKGHHKEGLVFVG